MLLLQLKKVVIKMNDSEFIEKSKKLVANYTINNSDENDPISVFSLGDVYVVWECKTLQNLKALILSSIAPTILFHGNEIFLAASAIFSCLCNFHSKLKGIFVPTWKTPTCISSRLHPQTYP